MSALETAATAPATTRRDAFAWRRAAGIFAAASFTIMLFALTPVTTRIAGAQIDGLTLGLVRSVGSGIFALALIALRRIPAPRGFTDWGLLLISALGSFAAFPLLFSYGAQLTSASHAGLLMATMPLLTGAIGLVIDRRMPRDVWFIGTVIALAGEAILVMRSDLGMNGAVSLEGDCLVLAACLLCACGNAAGGQLSSRVSSLAATVWAIAVASIALAPAAVLTFGAIEWRGLSPASWAAILHITLGASVLAYISWYWALARGGIARVSTFQFAQPIVVLLFAALLLREHLPAELLGGGATIVGGIALARRG